MKTIKTILLSLAFLIPLIGLPSCSSDSEEVKISNIQITNTTHEIHVGETLLLETLLVPNNISAPITWYSSDNDVAEVDNQGLVKAKSLGICTITASIYDNSLISSFEISITPITADKISLKESSISLLLGSEKEIEYEISPQNTTIKDILLSSNNEDIIKIVDNKKILAVGPGRTSISITIKDTNVKDSCEVIVEPIKATSIKLNKNVITIPQNRKDSLFVLFTPSNTTDTTIVWTIENTDVAVVNSSGIITAKNIGSTNAIATSNDGKFKASCKIEVIPVPVESISFSSSSFEMLLDETLQLTATITPNDAANKNITWTSSNENVLTVNKNGLVTSKNSGSAKITATTLDGNYNAECTIKIVSIIDQISLSSQNPSIMSFNGYITGIHYSVITNNSKQDIYLQKYEMIDSKTGFIIGSKSNIGTLKAGNNTNLGKDNLSNVYQPTDKWTFTYKGKTYTIKKEWEL